MIITVEKITPQKASEYLAFNRNNRPLRSWLVDQYAKDMSSGRWKLTHQGIAFNCDGTLLDGQHRLEAIKLSGACVEMMVARGIDSNSQIVMDDHAKRTAGDALSLTRQEKVMADEIAIIRAAIHLSGDQRKDYMTKQDLNEILDLFRPSIRFVKSRMPSNEKGVTSAPVKAAIVLAWFYVTEINRLKEFCEVLTGRELPSSGGDKAAVILREWLLKTGVQSGESSRREAFKKTQRAIIAFSDRQEIGKLYVSNLFFPWPLVNPVRTN